MMKIEYEKWACLKARYLQIPVEIMNLYETAQMIFGDLLHFLDTSQTS